MSKRNLLKITILAVAIVGLFLFVQANDGSKDAETCKESLDKNGQEAEKSGSMPWDNPVHQFVSTF